MKNMKITGIRRVLTVASALALALVARAEQESANPGSAKLADLPPAVQRSLQEKIGSSTILQIAIKPAVYCAQLDANGQKSEVRVSEEGKVLRIRSKQEAEAQFEEEQRLAHAGRLNTVELESVPAIARATITERSKGLTIDRIIKTPTIFVVLFDRAGEKIEIQLTDDGKIIGGSSS
jgi:hypothetical protein